MQMAEAANPYCIAKSQGYKIKGTRDQTTSFVEHI